MVSDSSATTTSYCSTRGGAKGVSFEAVVLGGLAEDRGLYVPEELPTVSSEELSEVCVGDLLRALLVVPVGVFQGAVAEVGGGERAGVQRVSRCSSTTAVVVPQEEEHHVTRLF